MLPPHLCHQAAATNVGGRRGMSMATSKNQRNSISESRWWHGSNKGGNGIKSAAWRRLCLTAHLCARRVRNS